MLEAIEGAEFKRESAARLKSVIESTVKEERKSEKVSLKFENYPFVAVEVEGKLRRLFGTKRVVGGGPWGAVAEMGTYFGTTSSYDPLSKATHTEKQVYEHLKKMDEVESAVAISFGHNELVKVAFDTPRMELDGAIHRILEGTAAVVELMWRKGVKDIKVIQLPSNTGSPSYDSKADIINAGVAKIIDETKPAGKRVTYWDLFGELGVQFDEKSANTTKQARKFKIDPEQRLIKILPSFAGFIIEDLQRCFRSPVIEPIEQEMRVEKRQLLDTLREIEKEIEEEF